METDPKLLEILVCPLTKHHCCIMTASGRNWCRRAAGLAYPIRGGVPVMLPGEARELTDEERDDLDEPGPPSCGSIRRAIC